MVILFNGPLLIMGRYIRAFRRAKLLEYSALVGNHGHLVYRKWIRNQDVGSPEILDGAGTRTNCRHFVDLRVGGENALRTHRQIVCHTHRGRLSFANVAGVRHRNPHQANIGVAAKTLI